MLAARVCWHHFKEGLTQEQTADKVGLSRASVIRSSATPERAAQFSFGPRSMSMKSECG